MKKMTLSLINLTVPCQVYFVYKFFLFCKFCNPNKQCLTEETKMNIVECFLSPDKALQYSFDADLVVYIGMISLLDLCLLL